MRRLRQRDGAADNWISSELSRKVQVVMKRKRPKLVVLDPEDFSEIALEKCAQRRQDQLDIASGRRTPEQVEKDNDLLGIDPGQFVTANLREACERL